MGPLGRVRERLEKRRQRRQESNAVNDEELFQRGSRRVAAPLNRTIEIMAVNEARKIAGDEVAAKLAKAITDTRASAFHSPQEANVAGFRIFVDPRTKHVMIKRV
ncbi:MAG: hypothetical protein V1911_00465 [Candidatus Micrarchaeota archaeon]